MYKITMMDCQRKMKELEESINELREIMGKLEKEGDQKNDIPMFVDFKDTDRVYYLDIDFNVCDCKYECAEYYIDFNTFHTAEYAENFRKSSIVMALLLHCKWYVDRDFEPEWLDSSDCTNIVGYHVFYNHKDRKWDIGECYNMEFNTVYFSDEEKAIKAADWMNKYAKEIIDG